MTDHEFTMFRRGAAFMRPNLARARAEIKVLEAACRAWAGVVEALESALRELSDDPDEAGATIRFIVDGDPCEAFGPRHLVQACDLQLKALREDAARKDE